MHGGGRGLGENSPMSDSGIPQFEGGHHHHHHHRPHYRVSDSQTSLAMYLFVPFCTQETPILCKTIYMKLAHMHLYSNLYSISFS